MFQISKPTKAQIIRAVEATVVVFVVSFVTAWAGQPDPFSKAALLAGLAAAGTAVWYTVKSLLTTL